MCDSESENPGSAPGLQAIFLFSVWDRLIGRTSDFESDFRFSEWKQEDRLPMKR